MSAEVVSGRVVFKFDLGSKPLTLTSDKVVSDGVWHHVIVERSVSHLSITPVNQHSQLCIKLTCLFCACCCCCGLLVYWQRCDTLCTGQDHHSHSVLYGTVIIAVMGHAMTLVTQM